MLRHQSIKLINVRTNQWTYTLDSHKLSVLIVKVKKEGKLIAKQI